MPREKMWVEYDDGEHLSQSKKKPGQYSPLTRDDDTNGLGQVTLSPVDEDETQDLGPWPYEPDSLYNSAAWEPSERTKRDAETIVEFLFDIGAEVARELGPDIKRVMTDYVIPDLRDRLKRFASKLFAANTHTQPVTRSVDVAGLIDAKPSEFANAAEAGSVLPRTTMSRSEAQARFIAALVAGAMIRTCGWSSAG